MSTSMLASPISTCKLAISQVNICAICRLLSLCAHQAHCVAIHTLATKLRSRDRASELVGSACFRNEDTVDAFNLCRTANIWRIARAMSRISFLVTAFSINVMIPFRWMRGEGAAAASSTTVVISTSKPVALPSFFCLAPSLTTPQTPR